MKQNEKDLLSEEKIDKESILPLKQDKNKKEKAKVQKKEGSIQEIEIPAEKNSVEIIKTEKDLEEEDKKKEKSNRSSDSKNTTGKLSNKMPLGFLFHIQLNKAKYVF